MWRFLVSRRKPYAELFQSENVAELLRQHGEHE